MPPSEREVVHLCQSPEWCHAQHGTLDQFPHRHDDGVLYAICTGANCRVDEAGHEHPTPTQPAGHKPTRGQKARARVRRRYYSAPSKEHP